MIFVRMFWEAHLERGRAFVKEKLRPLKCRIHHSLLGGLG
jgi:hypothetical protein